MTVAAGCHWHVRTVHGGDRPCAARLPVRLMSAAGAITYPLYLIHQHIGYIAITRLKGLSAIRRLLVLVISRACARLRGMDGD